MQNKNSTQSQFLFSTPIGVTITSTGITIPTYQQILSALQNLMMSIYGNDIILDDSTMDGQLIGILAEAFNQSNNTAVQIYNGFSPTYAQGSYLDSLVQINGLTRKTASYSTVEVVIEGIGSTVIENGIVSDNEGNQWLLPSTVTIPENGSITVTATAQNSGAVYSAPNTVTTIVTPFNGWQSVNNPNAANMGEPAESDASLRQRQAISQELPNQTLAQGLQAAILTLPNVTYCKVFVNNTNATDSNNIPAHSISVVVGGGDTQSIAQIIANKKSLGCGTYGQTSVTLSDGEVIQFQPEVFIWFRIVINISPTNAYNDNVTQNIINNIVNYINNANIGETIWLSKIQAYANVSISDGGQTYIVSSVTMGWSDSKTGTVTQGTDNAVLLYYQTAQTNTSMIQVNIGSVIS